MSKKQKNTLISYILFYGGFGLTLSSIFSIVIYTLVFKNHQGDVIHLMLFISAIIGIIDAQLAGLFNMYYYFVMYRPNYKETKIFRIKSNTGFVQGVPNNEYAEFNFKYINNEHEIILNKKNGIYTGIYNSKTIKMDMRGWIAKDKYIYELLETIYQLQYMNEHNIPKKYIYKTFSSDDIKSFTLKIKSDKEKDKIYFLSYDKKIRPSFLLKIKNHKKSKFIDNNFTIKDFYSFNYNIGDFRNNE